MLRCKTQVELEQHHLEHIKNRAKKLLGKHREAGTLDDCKSFKRIIAVFGNRLSEILEQYIVDTQAGIAKVKPIQIDPLLYVGADLVAYEAISCLFTATKFSGFYTVTAYSHLFANRLGTALKIKELEESKDKETREVAQNIKRILSRSSYSGSRKDKLLRDLLSKYAGYTNNHDAMVVLGGFCLDIINQLEITFADGIPRVLAQVDTTTERKRGRRHTHKFIKLEPWLMEGALQSIDDGHFLVYEYRPLIEVPIKHTLEDNQGGFHTPFFKYPVVQSYFPKKSKPSQANLDALNSLQEVPYRINTEVLKVFEYLVEGNVSAAGLSDSQVVQRVPELGVLAEIPKDERTEEQQERYSQLRKAMAERFREATASNSRVLSQFRILKDAQDYQGYPRIYFAYYFDYRGRLYTKSSNLSPQGCDYSKALIEFAKGVPVGDEYGELYLSIHGANCYGNDKMAEDEKLDWVLDNHQLIRDVASDPLGNLQLWIDTEEPWCFLAFCLDYVGFLEQGYDYVSHLAVALDGSCNGLQHLSAMKLDEVGGAEVNLIPTTKKADIYSTVAADLLNRLSKDHSPIGKICHKLPTLIDPKKSRKLAKKPTMTFAYASTLDNCLKNTREILKEAQVHKQYPEEFNDIVKLVATELWDSVKGRIRKGSEIMEYLKKVCRHLLRLKVSEITWVTPLGFTVIQMRPKEYSKKLWVTLLKGGNTTIRTNKVRDPSLSNKNVAAIAPNFIHSLDADHLQATVNSCVKHGVTDFMMIHDSFGTHAGNSKLLAQVLREDFVSIYYEQDVLSAFIEDQGEELMDSLLEAGVYPPEDGLLDITQVLESEYFFS